MGEHGLCGFRLEIYLASSVIITRHFFDDLNDDFSHFLGEAGGTTLRVSFLTGVGGFPLPQHEGLIADLMLALLSTSDFFLLQQAIATLYYTKTLRSQFICFHPIFSLHSIFDFIMVF